MAPLVRPSRQQRSKLKTIGQLQQSATVVNILDKASAQRQPKKRASRKPGRPIFSDVESTLLRRQRPLAVPDHEQHRGRDCRGHCAQWRTC